MSSVFVPPDIQTVTNAAAAALASENICAQIAAGLSSSPYAYMLDGVSPAAIMSAPKGLFTLNGAQVPLSSLLSFSSGQKYTVGPDGNYMLNAANGPAWDWSSGRRRLLIEGIGATNYWLNSENGAAWGGITNCTASVSSNALFGSLALTTMTQTASNAQTSFDSGTWVPVVSGDHMSFTVALLAVGSKTTAAVGIFGSVGIWGVDGDTTTAVLSGPCSISRIPGGLFSVTGLSTTIPTIVRITRSFTTSENAIGVVYLEIDATGTAGNQLKIGRPQFEKGYGSSYIPCGASPTAHPADIVTAASGLLALLTGANATLVIRGKRLGANPASSVDPLIGSTNRSASVEAGLYNAFAVSAAIDVLSAAPTATPISDVGVAVSWTAGQRKMAVNGGAVAKDNFALFSASDSGLQLFRGADGYANGYLDELSLWPIYASDAGLGAHARVYA